MYVCIYIYIYIYIVALAPPRTPPGSDSQAIPRAPANPPDRCQAALRSCLFKCCWLFIVLAFVVFSAGQLTDGSTQNTYRRVLLSSVVFRCLMLCLVSASRAPQCSPERQVHAACPMAPPPWNYEIKLTYNLALLYYNIVYAIMLCIIVCIRHGASARTCGAREPPPDTDACGLRDPPFLPPPSFLFCAANAVGGAASGAAECQVDAIRCEPRSRLGARSEVKMSLRQARAPSTTIAVTMTTGRHANPA